MISRQWHGIVKAGWASAYLDHLRSDTFPHMRTLPGFVDVSILQREVPDGTEFLIVSHWESLDAIRAFAGEHIDTAVVPQKARDMMIDFERTVRHYQVVDQDSAGDSA